MNKILVGVVLLILVGLGTSQYFASEEKVEDIGLSKIEESEKTGEIKSDVVEVVKNTDKGNILDLSGQNLTKAPSDIFNRENLEELNLSNNKIDGSLQAEVRLLKNLQVLDLSNNNFSGLPAEVGQLANLEILNLANNNLTGLPMELGNLKSIKQIDLRGNAYAGQDLDAIKAKLPSSVVILVD
jgi:Leucine-rich repeat (LRR) protein